VGVDDAPRPEPPPLKVGVVGAGVVRADNAPPPPPLWVVGGGLMLVSRHAPADVPHGMSPAPALWVVGCGLMFVSRHAPHGP